MPDYQCSFSMLSTDSGSTTKRFKGTFADFATAAAARDALQTDLLAATQAQITRRSLAETEEVVSVASGAKSVFLRASATIQLDGKAEDGNFTLPAPVDAINPSGSAFDGTATEWTDLMANFATGAWSVSDGDHYAGTVRGKTAYYGSGDTNF